MHSTGGLTNFRDWSLKGVEASLDEGISVHCTGRLSLYEARLRSDRKSSNLGEEFCLPVQIRRLNTER